MKKNTSKIKNHKNLLLLIHCIIKSSLIHLCYYISYIKVKKNVLIFVLRKSKHSLLQTKQNNKRLSPFFSSLWGTTNELKTVTKSSSKINTSWKYYISSHVDVMHLEKETSKLVPSTTFSQFKLKKIVPANLLKSPIRKIKVLQKSHSVNTVINIAKIFNEYWYSDYLLYNHGNETKSILFCSEKLLKVLLII